MKPRVYDDGGKSIDRYTLVMRSGNNPEKNEYHGFSARPFAPQGFGQYCGEYDKLRSYKHLGRRVEIESLPPDARKYVETIAKEHEKGAK